jgi:hypothetical protein
MFISNNIPSYTKKLVSSAPLGLKMWNSRTFVENVLNDH